MQYISGMEAVAVPLPTATWDALPAAARDHPSSRRFPRP